MDIAEARNLTRDQLRDDFNVSSVECEGDVLVICLKKPTMLSYPREFYGFKTVARLPHGYVSDADDDEDLNFDFNTSEIAAEPLTGPHNMVGPKKPATVIVASEWMAFEYFNALVAPVRMMPVCYLQHLPCRPMVALAAMQSVKGNEVGDLGYLYLPNFVLLENSSDAGSGPGGVVAYHAFEDRGDRERTHLLLTDTWYPFHDRCDDVHEVELSKLNLGEWYQKFVSEDEIEKFNRDKYSFADSDFDRNFPIGCMWQSHRRG